MSDRRSGAVAGATAEPGRIVASRLFVPPLRPGIVDRPRRLDGLLALSDSQDEP